MNRLALIIIFLAVTSLQAAKPNFLVIVTDDQRPDTIAALGNPRISTPNLDWLVKNGLTFENFICSNPLCVPSRAEILTGRTGFQNGVLGMGREKINPSTARLTELTSGLVSNGTKLPPSTSLGRSPVPPANS